MALGMMRSGEVVEVPGDLFGIANEISFRWPNLQILFLNPERANVLDAPYKIIEHTDAGPVFVMDVWELDQRVVDRLHMINAANIDVLDYVDKENAKVKKDAEAKSEEDLAVGSDLLGTAIEHLGKGKLEFKYTNDAGQKRVIGEHGARDKSVEVL